MTDLYTYIINERFTVNGTQSTKILLFDVDDTLIHSDLRLYVKKNGKVVKTLSSSEYNTYELQPGETIDYTEFKDENLLNNNSIFLKYWDTLKREYKKGTHIGILTARSDKDMFFRFFKNHGFEIKKELVFAINDPSIRLKGKTIEDRKAEVIKRIAKWGYKTIIFFDDNIDNLRTAKKLESQCDIKIHTIQAI